MGRKIKNEDQIRALDCAKAIEKQKQKSYDYDPKDFEIEPIGVLYKWRHNTWKTWCRGPIEGSGIKGVKNMIARYCHECKKPYGQRNLSFVHLYYD